MKVRDCETLKVQNNEKKKQENYETTKVAKQRKCENNETLK